MELVIIFNFLLLQTFFGVGGVSLSPPKITPLNIGQLWQNVSISTTKYPTIYSPEKGDDLNIKCTAPYPIQWNFTGVISPPEVIKIQSPTRSLEDKTFEIIANIFFVEAEDFPDVGSSVHVTCEKTNDSRVRDEMFVFVRGTNNHPLIQPARTTVVDSTLIPCPTKDPTLPVTLFRRTGNGDEEQVREGASNSVKYHPTEGFKSNQIFDGVYTCRQGSSSIIITASSSVSSEGFHFIPTFGTVQVFTEDMVQFECFSMSERPVKIVVDHNKNVTVSYKKIKHRAIAQVTSRHSGDPNDETTIKGKAVCLANAASRGNDADLVKEWSYEFIPTPELYLDNFEQEVVCLSPVSSKRVQSVRCKNSIDCDFMSHCLEDVTSCNFKKQKQFFATKNTYCWVEKLGKGFNCASVPYSHLNGLAQCTVAGLTKRWEIFVSLDFLKYDNWQEVPQHELLRMDEVPQTLYTNGTSRFFCMAVSYLFTDSLSFEIEYSNKTRTLLVGDGQSVNISNPGSENPRKIDEFNVIGILDIKLPLDTVAIHCLAPWWNSTDVLKTSRKFVTRHLFKPKFNENYRSASKRETFYTGDNNRRLTCFAMGEPQPEYTWYFNGKTNVSKIFPKLTTSLGSNGEGYLDFPTIGSDDKMYAGEYRCVAKNLVGSIEQRSKLEIHDEPISGKSVIYIITVVIILVILAVVIFLLFIFMRRYNQAKELVRSLTDNEIDEFFQGRPELLANANGNNVEVVDFLPYKNEYEIPLDDLEFDSSEKNILGTGEFSYVVKGKILSKNKPVAVKISKPSADVTLFKSILSEVKIMIYIGQHDNVVALIGVCTQGIRNRCIHIATDICDLGSLDGFLRKARPTFANLINTHQEIDTYLLPNNISENQISTLDLINFSAQIARGMEYLAYKSVIHADLAARNVLLTANKTAKISDFGLSKKLYESNNYVKKSKSPLPWRWMAVESLTTLTFSTNSDIWAYGATLFEIFTLGDIPFPNEEWNKEYLTRLASGMRMGRPKYSTPEIYSKIVACWENEPEQRPGFAILRVYFEEMLSKYSPYVNSLGFGMTTFEHSHPLTITGDSSHTNYNRNEFRNLANSTHVKSGPTVNHPEIQQNQRPLYVNAPEDFEPTELETISEKIEDDNLASIDAQQPLYANVPC